jgi:dienelactone hydrolase
MTVHKRELVYDCAGTRLVGELAWDAERTSKQPGIVVFHEGGGINPHPKERAAKLAALGYVALACDMYGNGEFSSDPTRRGQLLAGLRAEPRTLRARAQAALTALSAQPEVDAGRLAAIGFCFGGMCALELARAGAPLRAAVSFHGILSASEPAQAATLRASILVLHGADDPIVPPEQVANFIAEMKAADADWQLVTYGSASHGFTRPDAASLSMPGVAYQANADARSWQAMRTLFEERLGAHD